MISGRKKGAYLITGGTGFIGAHLCRHFLDFKADPTGVFASSNQIVCVNGLRNSKDSKESISDLVMKPGFKMISPKGGFESGVELMELSESLSYILHFASYPSPKDHLAMPIESLTADCLGTMRLAKVALKKEAVLMIASTGHIDQEHDPTNERSVYAEGKRFAEAFAMAAHRKFGLDVRIIRMFNSYGPGMRPDDGRVVPTFIMKALKGETLNVRGGKQLISLTYIDDMIDAIERVLYSDVTEPVEIGSLNRISIEELARTIIRLCASRSMLTVTSQQLADERMPDLKKAEQLGWFPRIGIEEGLKRTIEYFRQKI